MRIFTFNQQHYVRVNGRDFYCHAAFSLGYRGYAFFTIQGTNTLCREDLPGKSWQLLHRRAADRSHLYLIYDQSYFEYEKRESELLFVAPKPSGAKYLALRHIAKVSACKVPESRLVMLANSDQTFYGLDDLENLGNMPASAIYLNYIDPDVLNLLH